MKTLDIQRSARGAAALAAILILPPAHLSAQQLKSHRNYDAQLRPVAVEYVQPNDNQPPGDDEPPPIGELEALLSQPVRAFEQEVTTVSRQASTVGRSPAAVFVITQDMIRRSGARSIPEVLRLAPGVQVARIDANKWAVGIRGVNQRFNQNLLVQIDGRSVYTPFFAGVYWDIQDVLLADIERIEVIRGPGATIWGENAVNGIINIITKRARDTQGLLITGGGGTEERGFSGIRYGGTNGDDLHWRIYGKQFERDNGFSPDGFANDAWRQGRGGFRIDWEPNCCDSLTLQGDFYAGDSAGGPTDRIPDPVLGRIDPFVDKDVVSGGNVLARWTRVIDEDRDWSLQFYYDRAQRNARIFNFSRDTIDVDFQHRFPLAANHQIIWGAGYRWHSDSFTQGVPFAADLAPRQRAYDITNFFVQDRVTLAEDWLYFTAGAKVSKNVFTGTEYQPTGRLLWLPSERSAAWLSVSRAVRTPSRSDTGITFVTPAIAPGTFPGFMGTANFESEDLLAFEAGYRRQPTDDFSWELATFYFDYNDLRGRELLAPMGGPAPGTPLFVFVGNTNRMDGEAYGFELSANWQINPCWRLFGHYSFSQIQLHRGPGVITSDENPEGSSPHNMVFLQSSWDIGGNVEFDAIGRYVDSLPALDVHKYISLDLRLGWRPRENLELAVVGQNLLDNHRREFVDSILRGTEVERGVYGVATLTW